MHNSIVTNYVSALIVTTILCLLIYASVQQSYRTTANDPQIQLAAEIKDYLEHSRSVENIFPRDSIDLTRSLGVFAVLYDNDCQPIRSSGTLNNENPVLPKGVFDVVRLNGEDRVTWQPQRNVRMAMVAMKINATRVKYVAVGRSLNEVEMREGSLLFMIIVAWIMCMGIILINAAVYFFNKKKTNNG